MGYAQGTTVRIDASKAEIERLVTRYGASQFNTGWDSGRRKVAVQFDMNSRRIRFILDMPAPEEYAKYERKGPYGTVHVRERSLTEQLKLADQEMRRRWRALVLVVKAKLEAVESNISSFEEEFMAHIVTASGQTIGELVLPKLDKVASSGRLPPLLPGREEE